MDILELMVEAHKTAVEHGWWETRDCTYCVYGGRAQCDVCLGTGKLSLEASRNVYEALMLMVCELAEAAEFLRDGHPVNEIIYTGEHNDKPDGVLVELADVYIRIADLVFAHGGAETFRRGLVEKLAYNKTRPYRHGGKLA